LEASDCFEAIVHVLYGCETMSVTLNEYLLGGEQNILV